MYLFYYSYKTKEVIEYESDVFENIIEKIISLDFNSNFEFQLSKLNSALKVKKLYSNFYLNLFFEAELSKEGIGVQTDSYSKFENILNTYLEENEYEKTKDIFKNFVKDQKKIDKEKYKNWKNSYEIKKKKEKKRNVKLIILITLITISLLYLGNLFYSGEYKFIGQSTDITQAEIIKIEEINISSRYFFQKVYFEYHVNGKSYFGNDTIGKSIGFQYVGNKIRLKISKKHPERNLVLYYLN